MRNPSSSTVRGGSTISIMVVATSPVGNAVVGTKNQEFMCPPRDRHDLMLTLSSELWLPVQVGPRHLSSYGVVKALGDENPCL